MGEHAPSQLSSLTTHSCLIAFRKSQAATRTVPVTTTRLTVGVRLQLASTFSVPLIAGSINLFWMFFFEPVM